MTYPASPATRSMPSRVDQPLPKKISPRELRLVLTGLTLALPQLSFRCCGAVIGLFAATVFLPLL